MEVNSLQSSDYTLAPSLYFLNNTDSRLHISIKGSSLLNYLFFRQISLFKVDEKFLDDLISFLFIGDFIVYVISWYCHLNLGGSDSHFQQEFIEIDVLRAVGIGGCVVSYEIQLELNDSEHSRLDHILE